MEAARHTADAAGRKNLIAGLRMIGHIEAVPLLAHIAQYDPDATVKREALWTLRGWAQPAKDAAKKDPLSSDARQKKASEAVRRLDETGARQESG